jgi:uncharacterized protein involved in exopolysaccharide biosynthesis
MKSELANLDRQLAYKSDQEQRLRGNIKAYQQRIEATPTRESELTDLMRDYGTFQQAYRSLLAKKQDSQIAANLEHRQIGEQFRILDPAHLPAKPFSPIRWRYYGLGILVGLSVGLTLVGFVEYFDRTLRSEDDVLAALNTPVLATIPWIKERSASGHRRISAAALGEAAAVMSLSAAAIVKRILR